MSELDARTRWLALYVLCLASLMIVLDVSHRRRRAALDQGRPRLLRHVPRVGGERVPAHVRRLSAARRPARRPVRPAPPLPDRNLRVHGRVPRLRALDLAGNARRLARSAGARRCGRIRRLAVAHDQPLHRAGRAREGDGSLRVRRLGRRKPRRLARRDHHRRDQLALDLPRQLPDRRRCRPALPAAPARGSHSDLDAPRRRGRDHDHRRADRRRLRDRECQPERLDVGRNARLARRRAGALRRLHPARDSRALAAGAAPAVQASQPRDCRRRRNSLGRRDVRVVLPDGALHAARAGVQPARDRSRVPSRQRDHGCALDRHFREARDALRLPGAARDRARARGPWSPLARACPRRRELPRGHLPEHGAARPGRRHGLQPGAARGDERGRAARVGSRLGDRQHVVHDGWSARPRRPGERRSFTDVQSARRRQFCRRRR